jgi:hypothetical protein
MLRELVKNSRVIVSDELKVSELKERNHSFANGYSLYSSNSWKKFNSDEMLSLSFNSKNI